MAGGDEDDAEGAAADHAGEAAGAGADGELAGLVVPGEGDDGVLPLLVGVGVAGVFVEVEVAVGAAVDAELDGGVGLLAGVFDLGAEGEDGAGADVEGQRIERRLGTVMCWLPGTVLPVQKSYQVGEAGR